MIETQGCYQGTGVFKPFYMVPKGSGKPHIKIVPYANLFSPNILVDHQGIEPRTLRSEIYHYTNLSLKEKDSGTKILPILTNYE